VGQFAAGTSSRGASTPRGIIAVSGVHWRVRAQTAAMLLYECWRPVAVEDSHGLDGLDKVWMGKDDRSA